MPEETIYTPVKYHFSNRSDSPVYIHVYMEKVLVHAHFLAKGKSFDYTAEHGQRIRLEYPPLPHKTVLQPTDSLREKSRLVVIKNDGRHLKIKETFTYKDHVKIDRRKKKNKRDREETKNQDGDTTR